METNQVTPAPPDRGPQLHPLVDASRLSLRFITTLHDEIVTEYERVGWERIQQIDKANQETMRWLDMLKEIAKLPTGKRDNESIAQAVIRYVGELSNALDFEAGAGRGKLSAAREAFRQLCEHHNIIPPCNRFTATLPLGSGETPPLANCDTCGHPLIVHSTEAAS